MLPGKLQGQLTDGQHIEGQGGTEIVQRKAVLPVCVLQEQEIDFRIHIEGRHDNHSFRERLYHRRRKQGKEGGTGMPRTKLGEKYKKTAPPLDEAWGLVLCRMKQLGMDQKELAEKTGLGYDTIRHTINTPPLSWSPAAREKILAALSLEAKLVIRDAGG